MVVRCDAMIDIKRILNSPHITVRFFGIFIFHNKCGFGHCKHDNCKNCCHTNYYIKLKNSSREYRLPNFIQNLLRKLWD